MVQGAMQRATSQLRPDCGVHPEAAGWLGMEPGSVSRLLQHSSAHCGLSATCCLSSGRKSEARGGRGGRRSPPSSGSGGGGGSSLPLPASGGSLRLRACGRIPHPLPPSSRGLSRPECLSVTPLLTHYLGWP